MTKTRPLPPGKDDNNAGAVCPLPVAPDFFGVATIELDPQPPPADYLVAMEIASREAQARLGEPMLLSWYDRDRDFESPRHASECHRDSAVPGYVDYALSRDATLRIDIGKGRFVFFYLAATL